MNHPARQTLLEYAWSVPGDPGFSETAEHIAGCPRCRGALAAVRAVEQSLHRLGVQRPSAAFTRDLLKKLGMRETTPIWWTFLKNFAPILASGVVAAAVIALGSSTSGDAEPSLRKSLFGVRPAMEALMAGVDGCTAWTTGIAAKYLTFSLGSDAISLAMFLCFLFAGIGLLDRFLLGPMLRRKNY